ncbi:MAG: hypothetical protein NXI32_31130 [bacterium]|nr:hypothetical protein [bacterium]
MPKLHTGAETPHEFRYGIAETLDLFRYEQTETLDEFRYEQICKVFSLLATSF